MTQRVLAMQLASLVGAEALGRLHALSESGRMPCRQYWANGSAGETRLILQ